MLAIEPQSPEANITTAPEWGIFRNLTGYLAFFPVSKEKQKPRDELSDIRGQPHAIKALSAQQQDAIAALEKSLGKDDA